MDSADLHLLSADIYRCAGIVGEFYLLSHFDLSTLYCDGMEHWLYWGEIIK